ncbi:hypothetical protein [Anthocerotibacter panamensis]|uniref:hypothetical protein n=1 Tax=Anthocerotibacter panamensis TaxID=2857077 RepID=UPI001C40892D|nr:hypothetical protein [Anthocerotibacter panamensis]
MASIAPTFEEALTLAQDLVDRYEHDKVPATALKDLLATPAGARGFLVVFLCGDYSYADHPPEELLHLLQTAPAPLPELLVKNLVMSTAMMLTHTRQGSPEAVEGSHRVARRARALLEKLSSCQDQLQAMQLALTQNTGPHATFLKKWGYDTEQRQAMQEALAGLVGLTV